ncbi:MAG TPA: MMPL family transporter [Gaiellaceae bacterium]|nr:MMPL family transporter [Gaiellaceae bacterium]
MQLARLADAVSRRRRLVAAVWLALLAAGGWFSLHQSDHLSGGGWEIPGSASVRVADRLEDFPGATPPTFTVFVTGTRDEVARRLGAVRADLRGEPAIRPGAPQLLAGGRAALLPLRYAGSTSSAIDEATRLRRRLVDAHTKVVGQPAVWSNFQDVSKRQLARGELLGFPLILLILLAAFGTVVAAVAPLALGFAAVFLSGAAIYWLSRSFEISVYVTNMASMIGIGVAVDYSLFVVSRFRREIREGVERSEALRLALASSGTAVVFSGATVAVSLAALFAIDANALRSMAIGAIVVVCISVLASVTLLPALLAAAGARIDRLRLPVPWATGEEGSDAFWRRWADAVMRRPLLALAGGAAAMLLLASPLLAMTTFNRGLDELPADAEVRLATEQAQRLVGAGYWSPTYVIVRARPRAAAARIARIPGVVAVRPPVRSADGASWLVEAALGVEAESKPARAVVAKIRAAAGPHALVGGATVFDQDVERAVFGGLWKMLLFILGACYVVLLLLLRSVLLPLKAVLTNLLSVGAAYGVLVAIFQWGWLDWTGYRSPGYVDTIVPALVLAVTFGLSMDYEVFLLTRIRERWLEHGDNERAVAEGLVRSGRIITSAAAVMVAVFGAFAVAGAPSLKELGVGLAVAILLDATLVRLVIVPATMRLLGEWNWWLPGVSARPPTPGRAPAP